MTDQIFTTTQFAKTLDISVRKVISFIEQGFLTPGVQDASGHGSKRLWNYQDLIRAATVNFIWMTIPAKDRREWRPRLLDDMSLKPGYVWIATPIRGWDKPMILFMDSEDSNPLGAEAREAFPVRVIISMNDVHSWVKNRVAILKR